MTELSPEDQIVIAQHPLDDCLDYIKQQIRKIEKLPAHTAEKTYWKCVKLALVELSTHDAADNLLSKTGPGHLHSELKRLFGLFESDECNPEHFKPFTNAILEGQSDEAIWETVFLLLQNLANVTPPPTAANPSDQTPTKRSSSSFQGSEQTRDILHNVLFSEFRTCTFRNVEGFFERYLKGQNWEKKASETYSRVLHTLKQQRLNWYDQGCWTELPNHPSEDTLCTWVSEFQTQFLADSPNVFYRAKSQKNLSGAEANRQVDLLVKTRSIEQNGDDDEKHDWKDVLVAGEHKQSYRTPKEMLLQMSCYARDVFTAQPTRLFLHCFALHGPWMELWVFDRSGPYSSGPFNIHKEPEKFIRALVGYAYMTDVELGLDTFIERQGNDRFITLEQDISGQQLRLQLQPEPFVKQRAVVCRGTTCFRTIDQKNVIKFSWASDKRAEESDLLSSAQSRKVEGIASLVGYQRITEINRLRHHMKFPRPYKFKSEQKASRNSELKSASLMGKPMVDDSPQPSASSTKRGPSSEQEGASKKQKHNTRSSNLRQEYQQEKDPIETTIEIDNGRKALVETATGLYDTGEEVCNRLFGCLVISPAGRPLRTFTSVKELLTALRDAIWAHRSLYLDGNILHRDISENNIIITDPAETRNFTGMLIDLDLAKDLDSGRSGARHKTGTVEFMAIEVLEQGVHTYRHDLESFLYVLLWICARRAWEVEFQCQRSLQPEESVLPHWYTGGLKTIANAKRGYMSSSGFNNVLAEFPRSLEKVKPLCWKLRDILFRKDVIVGTHTKAKELYKKVVLAYEEALDSATLEMQ